MIPAGWGFTRKPAGYTKQRQIARDIAATPALLSLRSRRLAADVMEKYGVCRTYAWRVVGMARDFHRISTRKALDSQERGL